MNRKNFLSSVIGLGALVPAMGMKEKNLLVPPNLKPGDTIGITSPAGYITLEEIQPALQQIKSWGFNVKIGQSIGKKYFNFGGTDEERSRDLQAMLNDTSIKAIMCAR